LYKALTTNKLWFYFLTFLLIIPSAISEAKGAFLLLLIIFLYILYDLKLSFSTFLRLSAAFVLLVFTFYSLYSILGYGSDRDIFDVSYVLEYEMADRSDDLRLSRTQS